MVCIFTFPKLKSNASYSSSVQKSLMLQTQSTSLGSLSAYLYKFLGFTGKRSSGYFLSTILILVEGCEGTAFLKVIVAWEELSGMLTLTFGDLYVEVQLKVFDP